MAEAGWLDVVEQVKKDEEFQTTVKDSWDTRLDPLYPDRYALFKLMTEEGLTPWVAARRRHEEGSSNRSLSTLYYVARKVVAAIRERFGVDHEEAVRTLMRDGVVKVDSMLADDVKAAAKAHGYKVEETTEMRVFHTFRVVQAPVAPEASARGSAA